MVAWMVLVMSDSSGHRGAYDKRAWVVVLVMLSNSGHDVAWKKVHGWWCCHVI
jgi:hypothetical protein